MSEKIIIELDKGTVKHRCKDYVIYNVDWLKRHFEQERRFYSENGTLSADAEHIVRLIAKYFESPCTYDYDDVNAYDFCNSADEENGIAWCEEHCGSVSNYDCWYRFFCLMQKAEKEQMKNG